MSQPTPPPAPGQQPHTQQPHTPQPYAPQPYAQQPHPQAYPQQYAPVPSGYAQAGYGYAPVTLAPTNTLAIVSLICGLAGLLTTWFIPLVVSIAAVVMGHIAKRQIAERGENGSGLAVAGLVTGYIVIGLTVLVFGFMLLVLGSFGVFGTAVMAGTGS